MIFQFYPFSILFLLSPFFSFVLSLATTIGSPSHRYGALLTRCRSVRRVTTTPWCKSGSKIAVPLLQGWSVADDRMVMATWRLASYSTVMRCAGLSGEAVVQQLFTASPISGSCSFVLFVFFL